MDGEEGVGWLREVGREGKGVVDVRGEVCGILGHGEARDEGMGGKTYANGHEDVWQDEPCHLGTLYRGLGSETI